MKGIIIHRLSVQLCRVDTVDIFIVGVVSLFHYMILYDLPHSAAYSHIITDWSNIIKNNKLVCGSLCQCVYSSAIVSTDLWAVWQARSIDREQSLRKPDIPTLFIFFSKIYFWPLLSLRFICLSLLFVFSFEESHPTAL